MYQFLPFSPWLFLFLSLSFRISHLLFSSFPNTSCNRFWWRDKNGTFFHSTVKARMKRKEKRGFFPNFLTGYHRISVMNGFAAETQQREKVRKKKRQKGRKEWKERVAPKTWRKDIQLHSPAKKTGRRLSRGRKQIFLPSSLSYSLPLPSFPSFTSFFSLISFDYE